MKKIIINPHNCTKEEYKTLKKYLRKKCWDFKKVNDDGEIKSRKMQDK